MTRNVLVPECDIEKLGIAAAQVGAELMRLRAENAELLGACEMAYQLLYQK